MITELNKAENRLVGGLEPVQAQSKCQLVQLRSAIISVVGFGILRFRHLVIRCIDKLSYSILLLA